MDFEREAARHKDAVYRQMLRVCGNAEDAEDVLVEALVRAYKKSGELHDPAAFRAWLTTIGKRVCFRMKEQHRDAVSLDALREAGMAIPSEGPSAEDQFEMEQMHACVLGAFEKLPDLYKDVYRMRELEGRTAEDTAAALGLSVANVKTRLHRARALVRAALDEALCSP